MLVLPRVASRFLAKAEHAFARRCRITPVATCLITAKITPHALRLIRLVAAATGEKQYEVMARLLEAEARRLGLPIREAEGV